MLKAASKKSSGRVKQKPPTTPAQVLPEPTSSSYPDDDDHIEFATGQLSLSSEEPGEEEIEGLSPVAMRLLQAATDMKQSPDSYERAFLARQLIQCTFPHSDPGNIPIWSRTNGNLTLSIRPLYDEEKGAFKYPYGTIPASSSIGW